MTSLVDPSTRPTAHAVSSLPPWRREPETLRVQDFVSALRARRGLLLVLPLIGALLLGGLAAFVGKKFEARSRFMPQNSTSNAGKLAGLAAQFGIPVGGFGGGGETVNFYAELVTSREILRDVASTNFAPALGAPAPRTLQDVYGVSGDSATRLDRAMERLEKDTDVRLDRLTGLLTLTTRARDARLARAVNERYIELINDFNLRRRQTQARNEREFVEARQRAALAELGRAEDALRRFLERNRFFQGSPLLQEEHDRLQRELQLRQSVYTSLAQSYEQARIDEVRDTPVITVIDRPDTLRRRLARHIVGNAVMGAFLGFAGALVLTLLYAYALRLRTADPERLATLQFLPRWVLPRDSRA
jgi:uncharacterized protein involved in exopolysaccharide biosynthesis